MKVCSKCSQTKPLSEYYKKLDGKQPHCKVCHKAEVATWIKRNPDRHQIYRQKWFDKNPGYWTLRSRRDAAGGSASYLLRKRLRSLIYMKLKRRGSQANKVFGALPYTTQELKLHIESQFQPGMSWDNYGEWHIDHIIPDCAFNYTDLGDYRFRISWSLVNLQPLWARDNLGKAVLDKQLRGMV